jgi:hypothetical protein
MKNKLMKLAGVAMVLATAGMTAQAGTLNGSISFDGAITTDTGNLGTATAIASYTDLTVDQGLETGSFLPLNGGGAFNGVTFSTLSFGGNVLSTYNPTAPVASLTLWTVNDAGTIYSFVASSVDIATQNATFLNLTGSGTAFINGANGTAGTWSITDTGSTQIFTFGASTTVPDGGMTVAMLGMALGVCGIFARKLQRA